MALERRRAAGWAVHPGEILKLEFLKPLNMSGYALAKAIGVTPQRVSDIILKKNGISADMAVLLAKFFGSTPEFWMNLQSSYELFTVKGQKKLREKLNRIQPYKAA